jgi:hypothetical protein
VTAASKTDSVADLKGRFGRPRATVPLYLDGDAVAQAEGLEKLVAAAREYDETTNEPNTAPAIEKQLVAARKRAERSLTDFELQALSHRRWAAMISEHPPTPEQLADAPVSDKPEFNVDTLPGELVRAQLLSPNPGTDEQWAEFWDELSDGQMARLWINARALQLGDGALGKSELASEILQRYGGS